MAHEKEMQQQQMKHPASSSQDEERSLASNSNSDGDDSSVLLVDATSKDEGDVPPSVVVPCPSEEHPDDITAPATNNNNNNNGTTTMTPLLFCNNNIPPIYQTALRLGMAALRYGAVSYKVEEFLARLLKQYGFSCSVWVVNKYLFLSVYHYYHHESNSSASMQQQHGRDDSDIASNTTAIISGTSGDTVNTTTTTTAQDVENGQSLMDLNPPPRHHSHSPSSFHLPYTVSVPIEEGTDLKNLEDLSCLCADLLHGDNNIDLLATADELLQDLETRQPHWDPYSRSIAYALTSAGFAALLKGSWTDMGLSFLGGSLACASTTIFTIMWPKRRATIGMFVGAFLPAILATIASLSEDLSIDTTVVILSSVISEVPGFGITKGMSELGKNRILAGLGHWIGAFLTCVWLAFGSSLGMYATLWVTGKQTDDTHSVPTPIALPWFLLIAPVLGVCFSIYFSVGRPQLFMSVVVCCIACGMSLTIEQFQNPNLANVVAAFVTSLSAHIWSRSWHHKLLYGFHHTIVPSPVSIVLLPAFFVLVGGSVGVRAFVSIAVGDMDDGGTTLLQFLLVPATLVLGMYLAQVIIPSASVL